ncbi:MAG: hypothetical protein RMM17_13155 [Acidobacteriota bacterium]|nr:hypothetical protein [Acidobacteriota bacterium]
MPKAQSECIRCGTIIIAQPEPAPKLTKEAIIQLAIGASFAVSVFSVDLLAFLFTPLVTLVHELGHALTGWIFGYPSIPAFDFAYGGGVTAYLDRQTSLLVIIYAVFAYALLQLRQNKKMLLLVATVSMLYTIAAFTRIHELLMIAMGHGSELLFAMLFLYRAISGSSLVHNLERPAYAFAGCYITLHNLKFAYRLATRADYRLEYEEAKGGGHWMDFSRIALEFMDGKLVLVATIFLLATLLVPVLSYLLYRYGKHLLTPIRP